MYRPLPFSSPVLFATSSRLSSRSDVAPLTPRSLGSSRINDNDIDTSTRTLPSRRSYASIVIPTPIGLDPDHDDNPIAARTSCTRSHSPTAGVPVGKSLGRNCESSVPVVNRVSSLIICSPSPARSPATQPQLAPRPRSRLIARGRQPDQGQGSPAHPRPDDQLDRRS